MRYVLLLGFLLLISTNVCGTPAFEFSPTIQLAYHRALSLRFDEAKAILQREQRLHPNNLTIPFVENYIDFFTILIDENHTTFDQLKSNKEARLKRIREGDSNSPYYRFLQADIHLQWAMMRVKFGENFTAAREVRKAFRLLEQNVNQFPDFMPNKKSLGILHALIGTIPDNYRWGVKLLGMEGSIQQGQREIEEVLAYAQTHDFLFEEETVILYAFLLLHLGNQEADAWTTIRTSTLDATVNPLACFVQANIAMRIGQNDEAIQLLQNRPRGAQYHTFHLLDFLLGLAKLRRLDSDANVALKAYAENFKGMNYIREAYQKLAWHGLLFDGDTAYRHYLDFCKMQGNSLVAEDKEAYQEATANTVPHPALLRARLLFDGGYYNRAEQELAVLKAKDLSTLREQLELSYRKGRIAHRQEQIGQAVKYYEQTLINGMTQSYYFACNAALQLGLIYEAQHDIEQAKFYYKKCLSLHPDQYRTGLHQKAKSGLNRLKD